MVAIISPGWLAKISMDFQACHIGERYGGYPTGVVDESCEDVPGGFWGAWKMSIFSVLLQLMVQTERA